MMSVDIIIYSVQYVCHNNTTFGGRSYECQYGRMLKSRLPTHTHTTSSVVHSCSRAQKSGVEAYDDGAGTKVRRRGL